MIDSSVYSRSQILLLFFLSTGVILFAFQNCSEDLASHDVQSLETTCAGATTASNKVYLKKGSAYSVENTTSLSLLVDSQCLARQSEPIHFLGQDISWDNSKFQLPKVAVSIQLKIPASTTEAAEALALEPCLVGLIDNPTVQSNADDFAIDDPEAPRQEHLRYLQYYLAQETIEQLTAPVTIALVDTGVDYNHEDLKNRMWQNSVGHFGYNFVEGTSDPMDSDGHGTHIAGLIAAEENNSFGVAGLTGDFVKIMAVKSLGAQGYGKSSEIYNGIQFAIENGADIISLSIFSEGINSVLEAAIIEALQNNILVVLAIGNQSLLLTEEITIAPAYVGASLNGAITVASVDTSSSLLSFFSNYGAQFAEVGAPGAENGGTSDGGLLSTLPGQTWGRQRGTSQAAPIVAAAAATVISFLKSMNMNYTPSLVEQIIHTWGTTPVDDLQEQIKMGHVLDLGTLVQKLNANNSIEAITRQFPNQDLCARSDK